MTWKELKEEIEKMTPEQQGQEVITWGERNPMRPTSLAVCDENMYSNDDWDFCCLESDLAPEDRDDPGTDLYAKKGTCYLEIE